MATPSISKIYRLNSTQAKVVQYSNGSALCVTCASPVAAYVNGESGFGSIVLSDTWKFSPTTQKHVVSFLMKVGGVKLTSKEIRARISSGEFLVVPQNDIYGIVEPQLAVNKETNHV